MAVKGLFAIALVIAIAIGVTLPVRKSDPKPKVSQVATLAFR